MAHDFELYFFSSQAALGSALRKYEELYFTYLVLDIFNDLSLR